MSRSAPTHLAVRPTSSAPASPPATRLPGRRWRDGRLLAGVVLLLGSAALGGRLLVAADDTVPTWAAAVDLAAGEALEPADLVEVPARLVVPSNPYLTGPVPDGYVLTRAVGAGELVPGSAVVPVGEQGTTSRLVAVAVPVATTPALERGDRVDVWEVPDGLDQQSAASLLADGIRVVSVEAGDTSFGVSAGQRSVVLALDTGPTAGAQLDGIVSRLVTASASGRVVLTVDPGPR